MAVPKQISIFSDFQDFARERATAIALDSFAAPLASLEPEWTNDSQSIRRTSGKFIEIIAGQILDQNTGKITRKQPYFAGDGGYVVIIYDVIQKQYLVQFKAEPGNLGIRTRDNQESRVVVSAPLQTSLSNLKLLSGTPQAIPLGDLIMSGSLILPPDHREAIISGVWQRVPEDGGRFWEKINCYALIQISSTSLIDQHIPEHRINDFVWVSDSVLRQIFLTGIAGSHLRTAMSLRI